MLASFKMRGSGGMQSRYLWFQHRESSKVDWVIFYVSTSQAMKAAVHLLVVKRSVWVLHRQRSRVHVLQTTLECAPPLIVDSVEVSLSLHSRYVISLLLLLGFSAVLCTKSQMNFMDF